MPTWSGILEELRKSPEATGMPQFDLVRRKYLVEASAQTGRDIILYATKWTQPDPHVTRISSLLSTRTCRV